jgi:2-oxo-4-hydroxy-4-carboxy--5-ureidoimidazoline (OHCU) decarboxylase
VHRAVSLLVSFVEQGYDREDAEAAADAAVHEAAVERERSRVAQELERLNAAYEARFGFRYCVFVAGRPRAALLPGFEAALSAGRDEEIARALDAVVDIAEDRYRRVAGDPSGPTGVPPDASAIVEVATSRS